jgi:c-di-GMP-binding flagellar brake protein YcgR
MTGQRRTGKRVVTRRPTQATDRRAAQRVPVQLMVRFAATDSFQRVGHGVALDLSESGCKLRSTPVLPIGSFWDLYLTVHETSRPVLISEVRVVRGVDNQYGIEFLRIMAGERTRLRQFIWKHVKHSSLRNGPPLFTLIDRSNPPQPPLKSVP